MTKYTKSVKNPWFDYIALGLKTVEGRLNKGDFAEMKKGDQIEFTNGDHRVLATITSIVSYPSFYSYLKHEGLEKCLPGIKTLREGVEIYHKFYSPEQEEMFGVLAVRLKLE